MERRLHNRANESTMATQQPRPPAFLGIGAQKAGTTTLHNLLAQQPQIFVPPCKEVHYFSLHYAQGLAWYADHFAGAGATQVIGEITPYYLFHPQAARRIFNDLGSSVKIVVLLRDPLARTLSHYWHARRHGFETLPLEEALAAESRRLGDAEATLKSAEGRHKSHQEHSYLSRSLYRLQVERFWSLFGRDQVLVLPSEPFFEDPWPTLQRLALFLDLEPLHPPGQGSSATVANANPMRESRNGLSAELTLQLQWQLADSYIFARQELGWGNALGWQWPGQSGATPSTSNS